MVNYYVGTHVETINLKFNRQWHPRGFVSSHRF